MSPNSLLACMFSANLKSLGLFLPITAGIIIGCNLIFGYACLKNYLKNKKR